MEAYMKKSLLRKGARLSIFLYGAIAIFLLSAVIDAMGEGRDVVPFIVFAVIFAVIAIIREFARKYTYIGEGCQGMYVICKRGKHGFISEEDVIAVPMCYDDVYPFSDGLAAVCLDGKWGYLNMSNKVAIPLKYKSAEPFVDGVALVQDEDGVYYNIATDGKIIGAADMDKVEALHKEVAELMSRRKVVVKRYERQLWICRLIVAVIMIIRLILWSETTRD